jgi:hypothetical protein
VNESHGKETDTFRKSFSRKSESDERQDNRNSSGELKRLKPLRSEANTRADDCRRPGAWQPLAQERLPIP